jgi:hypothetical protein
MRCLNNPPESYFHREATTTGFDFSSKLCDPLLQRVQNPAALREAILQFRKAKDDIEPAVGTPLFDVRHGNNGQISKQLSSPYFLTQEHMNLIWLWPVWVLVLQSHELHEKDPAWYRNPYSLRRYAIYYDWSPELETKVLQIAGSIDSRNQLLKMMKAREQSEESFCHFDILVPRLRDTWSTREGYLEFYRHEIETEVHFITPLHEKQGSRLFYRPNSSKHRELEEPTNHSAGNLSPVGTGYLLLIR